MPKRQNKQPVDKRIVLVMALTALMLAILVTLILLDLPSPGEQPGGSGEGTVQADPGKTSPETQHTQPLAGQSQPGTEPEGSLPPQTQQTEPTQPAQTRPIEPPPTVAPGEYSYEQWLAAAMVAGMAMEYPDFQLLGVYAASEVPVSAKMQSQGACIHFVTGGTKVVIWSQPLVDERSEKGTTDLYTGDLGYATFDICDPAGVKLADMQELELEALGELIAQSVLITVSGR